MATGAASFGILSGLFLATMVVHYRAIDGGYLLFALARIAAISCLAAAVAALGARWLRPGYALLLGVVLGVVGAGAYVATI